MADLSDYKRGQIVGVCMEGASVRKTAEIFDAARTTVWKVMIAFEKEGKTSLLKKISGRKRKLSDWDRRNLKLIIRKDHKNTAPKITAELNDDLKNSIYSETVWREPHKAGFQWEGSIRKPY